MKKIAKFYSPDNELLYVQILKYELIYLINFRKKIWNINLTKKKSWSNGISVSALRLTSVLKSNQIISMASIPIQYTAIDLWNKPFVYNIIDI